MGGDFRMMKDDMSAAIWDCTATQRSVTNWGPFGFRPYAEGKGDVEARLELTSV